MEEPQQPNDPKQADQQLHPNNNKPIVPVDNPAIARAVAVSCSLLVFLSGAVLIVCWAVFFHPSNRQLWMVPFGLVLIGTPMVVWCSVLASGQKLVAPETAVEPPDLEK